MKTKLDPLSPETLWRVAYTEKMKDKSPRNACSFAELSDENKAGWKALSKYVKAQSSTP